MVAVTEIRQDLYFLTSLIFLESLEQQGVNSALDKYCRNLPKIPSEFPDGGSGMIWIAFLV